MESKKPARRKKTSPRSAPQKVEGLAGRLLLAAPQMPDSTFAQSVIYIYHHSKDGAMGFVLNKPASDIELDDLLKPYAEAEVAPPIFVPAASVAIVHGGPIDEKRGFVLHTRDYHCDGTQIETGQALALTTSTDILSAMAKNMGPRKALIALGYAGWGPGQLEKELRSNSWLTAQGGEEFVFHNTPSGLYAAALARTGVNLAAYSPQAGLA